MNAGDRNPGGDDAATRPAQFPDSASRHHAGPPAQRQAMPVLRRHCAGMLALALATALGGAVTLAVAAEDPPPAPQPPLFPDLPPARVSPGETSQRRLLDERRQLDGRIDSLDRQLAPWESERLRSPGLAPPGGLRGPGDPDDPVMRRREMERRDLDDQRRMIDDRLRWDRQR